MSIRPAIDFLEKYSSAFNIIWKLLFYPILFLCFYAATAFLNINYVSQAEFTSYKNAEISGLKEMSGKLDTLLLRDSSSTQQMADVQRRLNRLEDKVDGLSSTK